MSTSILLFLCLFTCGVALNERPIIGILAEDTSGSFAEHGRMYLAASYTCGVALNERPIIGILAEDTSGSFAEHGRMYLAASYVKFVESAGARVVPILNNLTESELDVILNSVNGVLFPGGSVWLKPHGSGYFDTAMMIYNYFLKENSAGRHFPLWGTCLGFEALTVLVSGSNLLSAYDSENYSIPLMFDPGFNTSRMFKYAPANILEYLSKENVTMNNHISGISPETFMGNEKLNSTFNILSRNKDRAGKLFVSTIEGQSLPIYGVQWHPEKNSFEWTTSEGINHSAHAVAVTQYMADFLVQQARMSNHTFTGEETESKYLIYNYQPVYTGHISHSFEQCYFW